MDGPTEAPGFRLFALPASGQRLAYGGWYGPTTSYSAGRRSSARVTEELAARFEGVDSKSARLASGPFLGRRSTSRT